jgi:hypothetical protein
MEPIVLVGLIVVIYGGYVSIMDCLQSLSGMLKRRVTRVAGQRKSQRLFARQMVRMHV